MNILLRKIYFLSIILLFFPALGLFIPTTKACISFGVLLLPVLCAAILVFYRKNVFNLIAQIHRFKIIKQYILFLFYIIVSIVILNFFNYYTESLSFYIFKDITFFIPVVLVYFLPLLGCIFKISFKTLIKLLYITIFFILCFGLIQYLVFLLNIPYINIVFDLLTNLRVIYENPNELKEFVRAYSTFMEPSAFGQFIFIFLPIINSLAVTKYKIFNNNLINKVIKKTIIPITFLDIIATKSPIYLIFCIIELIVLIIYSKRSFIKRHLKQTLMLFLVITLIVVSCCRSSIFDDLVENSYLNRIKTTIESIKNPMLFSTISPSLATRIYFYANQVEVFKKHPILGCGLGNIDKYAYITFGNSSLIPTWENLNDYKKAQKRLPQAYSMFFTTLAELGILGSFILMIFLLSNIMFLSKYQKYFVGLIYDFAIGVKGSLISIVIISFYNLNRENAFIWFILGIIILFYMNVKYQGSRKCINK